MTTVWRIVWLLVALGLWGKLEAAKAAELVRVFPGEHACPPAPWGEHPAFYDKKHNRVPPPGNSLCFVPDPSLAIICSDYAQQLDCRGVDEPAGRVWVAPVLPNGVAVAAPPDGFGGVAKPAAKIPKEAKQIMDDKGAVKANPDFGK